MLQWERDSGMPVLVTTLFASSSVLPYLQAALGSSGGGLKTDRLEYPLCPSPITPRGCYKTLPSGSSPLWL